MFCSNNDLFKREMSYLRNLFLKNGYPSWFFDQSLKKYDDRNKLGTQKLKTDFSRSIEFPYYGKSSYQLSNRLIFLVEKKLNIEVQCTAPALKPVHIFN